MLLRMFGIKRLPRVVTKRVIVHTRDSHSIEGILLGVYADAVSVGHASFYGGVEGGDIKLEGDQIVPIGNVSFIQELGPWAARDQ